MSDCGGDCGGDSGGDDVQMTTFDSDYPAETSYSVPDSPQESTHVTYFDSSAPADEPSHDYGNNGVSETFVQKYADQSYSFFDDSNNCNTRNECLPSTIYYNTPSRYYNYSNSTADCNCGTYMRILFIALVMFVTVIIFILILRNGLADH